MRRSLFFTTALLLVVNVACTKQPGQTEETKLETKTVTRTVTLYYESPDMLLAPEQRTLPLPESDNAAMSPVIRELIKGSKNAAVPRLFPADAVVRGVYSLPDGTAIVDLGGPTLTNGWSTGSHTEMMALYSVVHTLTNNFKSVQRVRFLLNGQIVETVGGHIRVERPLRPLSAVMAAPQVAQR